MRNRAIGSACGAMLALLSLLGATAGAAEVVLEVRGEVKQALKLTAADLAAMPRKVVEVDAPDQQGKARYEGVTLGAILERAGVGGPEGLRGEALRLYAVVEAGDGYQVVFALPELDPAFTDRVVLLADRREGSAIAAPEGPLRVVIPDEKRHPRWIREVTAITVRKAPSR